MPTIEIPDVADLFRPVGRQLQGQPGQTGGGHHPGRKIATLCEWFGVETAWQEGGDTDPVKQMAPVHVDLALTAFGIQEENQFGRRNTSSSPATRQVRRRVLGA